MMQGGKSNLCKDRPAEAQLGKARRGLARRGAESQGAVWQPRHDGIWLGEVRRDAARCCAAGKAWFDVAARARLGAARPGLARHGWNGDEAFGVRFVVERAKSFPPTLG
jgi:hypothetical protein